MLFAIIIIDFRFKYKNLKNFENFEIFLVLKIKFKCFFVIFEIY